MKTLRSIDEINDRIRKKEAVVCTAEEVIGLREEHGLQEAAKMVDVVTTATFGPMCSSGAFLNFGHSDPPIRMGQTELNGVEAYSGIAAVDAYIGATQPSKEQGIQYGGAHVICDLIAGKSVHLKASSSGTDCYPAKHVEASISLETINEAYLFNPRNAYQNYAAATNSSEEPLYTYMGKLLPRYANIRYSTCGCLSPLLNDPDLRTIGIGTRIFLAGGIGYVAWEGTQFFTGRERNDKGIPIGPAASLALIGSMKLMSKEYVQPATIPGYGVTLCVGVGIPIPILDEEIMRNVCVRDEEIHTIVLDYSHPGKARPIVAKVSYADLRSGSFEIRGTIAKTHPMSSMTKARRIACLLKDWIHQSQFLLTKPVAPFSCRSEIRGLPTES